MTAEIFQSMTTKLFFEAIDYEGGPYEFAIQGNEPDDPTMIMVDNDVRDQYRLVYLQANLLQKLIDDLMELEPD